MIRLKRKAILAEIETAVALGAAADLWEARAAQRLRKLSADFPPEAPCRETFPFHADADDLAEFDRILPPGWWLVPSAIIGLGIISLTLWAVVVALIAAFGA